MGTFHYLPFSIIFLNYSRFGRYNYPPYEFRQVDFYPPIFTSPSSLIIFLYRKFHDFPHITFFLERYPKKGGGFYKTFTGIGQDLGNYSNRGPPYFRVLKTLWADFFLPTFFTEFDPRSLGLEHLFPLSFFFPFRLRGFKGGTLLEKTRGITLSFLSLGFGAIKLSLSFEGKPWGATFSLFFLTF